MVSSDDALDIRKPVMVEMEYEVLQGGHLLVPNFHFYNEDGVYAFVAHEADPNWRGRERPNRAIRQQRFDSGKSAVGRNAFCRSRDQHDGSLSQFISMSVMQWPFKVD